jgi:hypothetical protein
MIYYDTEEIITPFVQLPETKQPPDTFISPIKPPPSIKKEGWDNWWTANKHFYGNRPYYDYLGYPLWWLNYYYPETQLNQCPEQKYVVAIKQPINLFYVIFNYFFICCFLIITLFFIFYNI